MILDQQGDLVNIYPANEVPHNYTEYAHRKQYRLPEGCWILSIVKGDAWLFQNGEDRVLHMGEKLQINNEQGDMYIRSLYARGFVKFTLAAIEVK